MLGLDVFLFFFYFVNQIDYLGCNLGIWVKGQVGNWDYCVVMNNLIKYDSGDFGVYVDWANICLCLCWFFYFKYQFVDYEGNGLFGVGIYLGKKKIFNLGVGFVWQFCVMWMGSVLSFDYYDMFYFVVDLYVEWLVFKGIVDVFMVYFGFFNYDFGLGYLCNLGVNNFVIGLLLSEVSFNGIGVVFLMIGIGQVLFW